MQRCARRGDDSTRSSLELVRSRYGIGIICRIDQERRLEALNPRFRGAFAGGSSPETYRVLWQLYNQLPTDERKWAFIASKHDDGNRLLISRNDDVVVATSNSVGEFGVKVFVGNDSPIFERVKELFQAIEDDNRTDHNGNALQTII